MPDPGFPIRLFSLDEANAVLPRVSELLAQMRACRKAVVAAQALADVEELTGGPKEGPHMSKLLGQVESDTRAFHDMQDAFQRLGCELKDLERGLVDFYSVRGNDVVYLCWLEGEPGIGWWHPLHSGFQGRAPL